MQLGASSSPAPLQAEQASRQRRLQDCGGSRGQEAPRLNRAPPASINRHRVLPGANRTRSLLPAPADPAHPGRPPCRRSRRDAGRACPRSQMRRAQPEVQLVALLCAA
eukprot:scaffold18772_cov112-Isochrysis_galbana.AAC.12